MSDNEKKGIINFSDDVFLNIVKYLTFNESLKLKLINKKIGEYLKEENVYYLNNTLILNNYLKFVKFVNYKNFINFLISILKDKNNIYNNPYYELRNVNFGVKKNILISSEKGYLKNIILKGEFLRNTNFHEIYSLIKCHSNTLEKLSIYGLNDINCCLFIYSNYSVLYDFLAKEILQNNINYISKEELKKLNLDNLNEILNKYEEDELKNVFDNFINDTFFKNKINMNKKNECNIKNINDKDEEEKKNEQIKKNIVFFEKKHYIDDNNKKETEVNDYFKNYKKYKLLCDHIYIVYNSRKNCFEKIKNYKENLNLNNYITKLDKLQILNLTGIQCFDMISMLPLIDLPSLKILNISSYDYFFYFYQMFLSLFSFGPGIKNFKKYINYEKYSFNIYKQTDYSKTFVKKKEEYVNKYNGKNTENLYKLEFYEQEIIKLYESNLNKDKIFYTPNIKDKICFNYFNKPIYYADGCYITFDSEIDYSKNTLYKIDKTKKEIKIDFLHKNYEKKKIKKLKNAGYIWLINNFKFRKNINVEILYYFKNIIQNEEKKARLNIISLLNNLNLEYFSLFNYNLSSPFMWLILFLKHNNLKTVCIIDLCLPHLLCALTFLEAFLKKHLFNLQGMMRRRRKRNGNLYFTLNDYDEIYFVNNMYSNVINELNKKKDLNINKKKINIVIYIYNSKKKNKQFIKLLRKISRSMYRCNYFVYFSIQYYKYKYFNKYIQIDNLYRYYIINILLSNHNLYIKMKKYSLLNQ